MARTSTSTRFPLQPIYLTTKYIDGAYLSATFGEGAFWTKRPPMDEQQLQLLVAQLDVW